MLSTASGKKTQQQETATTASTPIIIWPVRHWVGAGATWGMFWGFQDQGVPRFGSHNRWAGERGPVSPGAGPVAVCPDG
jgi:hypothetical protein